MAWCELPICFPSDSPDLQKGKRLHRGRFGVTFRASYCGDKVVAKQYHALSAAGIDIHGLADNADEFSRSSRQVGEAVHALTGLEHPSLVSLVGLAVGQFEGNATLEFVISEWIDGGDLGEWLASALPPEEPQLMVLGAQLSAGLEYLHSQDQLAGNLKPSNVLIDGPQREAKIADFGLVTVRTRGMSAAAEPCVYAAPEVTQGAAESASSNVYSLACILLHGVQRCAPAESHPQRLQQLAECRVESPLLQQALDAGLQQTAAATQIHDLLSQHTAASECLSSSSDNECEPSSAPASAIEWYNLGVHGVLRPSAAVS